MDKPNRLLDRLSNLLVPKQSANVPQTVNNDRILHELIRCFEDSLERESFGTSLLFNAHYIIILHPDSYKERLAAFPVIINEAVRAFYERLRQRKRPQDEIPAVSSHWYFKFGPGTEFEGKPIGPGDVEVIGSLTGLSLAGPEQAAPSPVAGSVKATRKVKNTNLYEKLDVNAASFGHIDFREAGAFAIKIDLKQFANEPAPAAAPSPVAPPVAPRMQPVALPPQPVRSANPSALAKIDCYLADKNREETHWMLDREVVVARQEPDNLAFPNYLRLDSPYVSNPHARIRYNDAANRFEIASFSRNETRVNEQIIVRSEPNSPQWNSLPDQAQILLNGIVTLHFTRNV